MEHDNDIFLSKLTVKLVDLGTNKTCGTGIIYNSKHLNNSIYVLTAAHCLYADGDSFQKPYSSIGIELYNKSSNSYKQISHTIDFNLVSAKKDEDVAILILDKNSVEKLIDELPMVQAVKERHSSTEFVVKGFPSATLGQELDSIQPVWSQAMTGVAKFQLRLNEDYNSWSTKGFSGSGVFIHTNNKVYLFGIFTRFRSEGKGKVIYCQYLKTINTVLEANYLPLVSFTFLNEHGLTPESFAEQINRAVKNLGPRFSKTLNFELPIVREFHDLTRDSGFKARVVNVVDRFLLGDARHIANADGVLNDVDKAISATRKWIVQWIDALEWTPDKTINITPLLKNLDGLEELLNEKTSELYKLQLEKIEELKAAGKEPDPYSRPLRSELHDLRKMIQSIEDFRRKLGWINFKLANRPFLIIDGEAGTGKSHLLGDIATKWQASDKPVVLLLGQLFRKSRSLWENIASQLDQNCTKKEFLESLNKIGKELGFRVPILIDALNEGDGKEIWHSELSGLIDDISKYPYIGFVVTVRTTYIKEVIPKEIQEDSSISKWTHDGFKGNEYDALRLFCDYYELQQPSFPILAPEFTNPLFLQLVCEGTKNAGQKSFPKGFQGFVTIFGYYLSAVASKLTRKREDYKLRSELAEQAIQLVAEQSFNQKDHRFIPIQTAKDLFDAKFPKHPLLLSDLIEESVFIQNLYYDYTSGNKVEGIMFAYERIGDYYIADKLLTKYKNAKQVKEACNKGKALGMLLEGYGVHQGIVEALAVLLPERYAIELFEAFDWAYTLKRKDIPYLDSYNLNYIILQSLKWRKAESVDREKILTWIRGKYFRIETSVVLDTFIELSTCPGHGLNSDFLFGILSRKPLGERDAFWQGHMYYHSSTNDDGQAYPLRRLIDWAWQENISFDVDTETARLAAQTLSWLLSSTVRTLRDQATKALVNLLQEKPDALIKVLTSFEMIDDPYISERLYAVALGCALRTSKREALGTIANYTYEKIFKQDNPPTHILLRDYARTIVEYAIYKGVGADIDVKLIRPPYRSRLPDKMPTVKEIKKYSIDHKTKKYKEAKYARQHNQIHFSVMDWDFGRYTIESALNGFSPASFKRENEITGFLKTLPAKPRKLIKQLRELRELVAKYGKPFSGSFRYMTPEQHKKLMAVMKKGIASHKKAMSSLLTEEQLAYYKTVILPHFDDLDLKQSSRFSQFQDEPIKRYIVKRAHELGYDANIHGAYDYRTDEYNHHRYGKVERIGKKYQWIAFHEAMGLVADNYQRGDDWNDRSKLDFYKGPWQMYLRDIDPAFITKAAEEKEDDEEDLAVPEQPKGWWMDHEYAYWNDEDSKWAKNTTDLPNPESIIERIDENGVEWLYLRLHATWEEPKPIGKEKYHTKRKEIWYMFQGYLVKKKDLEKIKLWLLSKDLRGRWLPESHSFSGIYNRENYWSPAAQYYAAEREKWVTLSSESRPAIKAIIASNDATGELSDDKSGAHFSYDIPCQEIFDGMNLQYGPKDGDLVDDAGRIIATSINPRGLLIRKKEFLEYLDKAGLEIIWAQLGEKRVYNSSMSRHGNYFGTISGVYNFENGKVAGSYKLRDDK